MENSIKGTQTEINLLKAFAGESQAKNRYEWFAKVAAKEGYQQIAELFQETAMHELSHAKQFFKFLEGGNVEITATYPAGKIGSTLENLNTAASGENEEWTQLYPEFARVAAEEGFKKIGFVFKLIAQVEEEHEKKYRKLIQRIEDGTVFESDENEEWECRKCGYVHKGKKALKACPACMHPQAYFERKKKNY
ncbi:MAG: rubrerythrin family protein [Prolixibacteraceae bacterium]|jgi:rubrerythrin|nr:rubrerythrin family protein [Prolixibacteraceae bacterium]